MVEVLVLRRYAVVLLILVLALVLNGCIKGHAHYTINKDSSGDASIKLALDRGLVDLLYGLEQQEHIESVLEEFRTDGYTITRFVEGDYKGFEAVKHFDDADEMFIDDRHEEAFTNSDGRSNIKKGFFFNRYRFTMYFDMESSMADYYSLINEAFLRRADFDFILTLPTRLEDHNASKVSEDGMTYSWSIILTDVNEIVFEFKKPNLLSFGAVGIVALAFIGVGIFFTIRYIKNKKSIQ